MGNLRSISRGIRRAGKTLAKAEQIAQWILAVLQGVGYNRSNGAAEFKAVAAATTGDENPPHPRGPVNDEMVVGRIGVQAGAAPYQLGSFQRGQALGDKGTCLIEEVGRGWVRGRLRARRPPLCCPRRF